MIANGKNILLIGFKFCHLFFSRFLNLFSKFTFYPDYSLNFVFSWLNKWGIKNAPAAEEERFAEARFVERLGQRRPSWLKTNPRQSASK